MPERTQVNRSRFGTAVRLSLHFALLYAALSAAVFAGAYWLADFEVRDWIYDQMRSDAETLTQTYRSEGAEALISEIAALSEVTFENSRIYYLTGPDGEALAGNVAGIDFELDQTTVDLDQVRLKRKTDDEVKQYLVLISDVGPYKLIQGTSRRLVEEVLEALEIAFIAGFAVVVLLGLMFGRWIGRQTERQILAITHTLEQVSDGALADRVPVIADGKDDLSRVSHAINATLDQIGRLLESQQQISDDIAHDLRTPLQRLRQRLERMNREVANQGVDPADVNAALSETEDIISTFQALLRIAQISAGDRRERFAPVDLNEVFSNVVDAYEPVAEDQGHLFRANRTDAPSMVIGDKELASQLLSNLVENAIRHCPTGSEIEVALISQPDKVIFRVSDNGPGISRKDQKRVFRRFFRVEKSRSTPGNGLGLTLVKVIADLHEAEISFSDYSDGLSICVSFAAV